MAKSLKDCYINYKILLYVCPFECFTSIFHSFLYFDLKLIFLLSLETDIVTFNLESPVIFFLTYIIKEPFAVLINIGSKAILDIFFKFPQIFLN